MVESAAQPGRKRRPVVRTAAFATCVLVAGCATPGDDTPDPAAHAADAATLDLGPRFPRLPEGVVAAAVVAPPASAAIAIVHVPQTHLPPGLPPEPPADAGERAALADRVLAANESQRAVHAVLDRLAAAGWDRVFAEGTTAERRHEDYADLATEYVVTLSRIDATLDLPPPGLLSRFAAYDTSGASGDPVWESFRYAPGADLLLAMRRSIRLLPAEREDLLVAAGEALRTGGAAAAAAWSDAREDAILAEVASHGDGAAVVVLGAAHDLSDNVARWNRANPGRRIALVVVAPR